LVLRPPSSQSPAITHSSNDDRLVAEIAIPLQRRPMSWHELPFRARFLATIEGAQRKMLPWILSAHKRPLTDNQGRGRWMDPRSKHTGGLGALLAQA
jgi:hypothetical protein